MNRAKKCEIEENEGQRFLQSTFCAEEIPETGRIWRILSTTGTPQSLFSLYHGFGVICLLSVSAETSLSLSSLAVSGHIRVCHSARQARIQCRAVLMTKLPSVVLAYLRECQRSSRDVKRQKYRQVAVNYPLYPFTFT